MLKPYTFVDMIVKSALIFLSIVDFFWNGYEQVSQWVSNVNEKKAMSNAIAEPAKPSYSIQ